MRKVPYSHSRMDFSQPESTNQALLDHLEYSVGVLQSPTLREAFTRVDRADYIPQEYRPEAHEDYAVPIGHGQTISQPTTVAFMLEKLEVQPGQNVLDVGAGSGWSTALLAHLVGETGYVTGVELIPELAEMGQGNLDENGVPNARIEQAIDTLGKHEGAPFDRILVSAAAEVLPEALIKQLKDGGRMVLPIGDSLTAVEKHEGGGIETEEFPGFVFVPLEYSLKQ